MPCKCCFLITIIINIISSSLPGPCIIEFQKWKKFISTNPSNLKTNIQINIQITNSLMPSSLGLLAVKNVTDPQQEHADL